MTLWVEVTMMFSLRKMGRDRFFTDRSLISGVREKVMDDHYRLLEPHV